MHLLKTFVLQLDKALRTSKGEGHALLKTCLQDDRKRPLYIVSRLESMNMLKIEQALR